MSGGVFQADVSVSKKKLAKSVLKRSSKYRLSTRHHRRGGLKKHLKAPTYEECQAKHNPSWIRNHICMRECIQFTPAPVDPERPDPHPDDPKCQCGNRKSDHDDRFCQNPDTKAKWKVETHTHTCTTNAFGEIEFIGAAGAGLGLKPRKYVRVDHNIHPNHLMQLLNTQWNLGTPKLLISVTGGARNFHMNTELENVFRKGLIKAALSTGTWIITGGTDVGVMKYVGDAIKDYALVSGITGRSVVAIGVASWGVIEQREKLIAEEGCFPAYYRVDAEDQKGVLLDPNHTHFILADDGTVGEFGVNIKFRARMEREISEQVYRNTNVSLPVVCLMVEGGPNTLATVYEAIMNGTPAVIIAGSGRAADILAFAFQRAPEIERTVKDSAGNYRKEKETMISDSLMVRLADMFREEFGEKELDIQLNRIKEMLMRRHLVTVYELGTGDIDGAILHALLTGNRGSIQDRLQLAQIWNRVDVAKREIFTEDWEWKKGELDDALHYALVNNQTDFVKLFMENGVSLKDYLTVRELTHLYNEVEKNTLLYEQLDKHRGKSSRKFTLIDVGGVIQELTTDTNVPLYLHHKDKFMLPESDFCSPARELFLYAILQNRVEMARMFWEEGKEAIPSALTASKILTSLAAKESHPDHSVAMKSHAASYEELALGVLNECYNDDKDLTALLLVMEQENWGKTTSLSLAKQGDNKNFIAHTGVQNLLTEIWSGKLSYKNNYWLLWACTFLPPLIPCIVNFREDVILKSRKSVDKQSKTHEIAGRQNRGQNGGQNGGQNDTYKDVLELSALQNAEENGAPYANNVDGVDKAENEDPDKYQETADIDITNSGKKLAWWQRFSLFYCAPIIIFRHNVLSYLVFLLLFSYIILANFTPTISIFEMVLIGWVGSLYLEELRQIVQGESNSWHRNFWFWISDYWNMVDIATLVLFAVGVGLRFFDDHLDHARIILALDLAIFYIRILQMFAISKNLGPKLIMIGKMLVDLAFFVAILCVFLIAYGVASQAILYPNSTSFQEVITGVFFKAYFQMDGELFLEDIEGNNGCSDNITLIAAGAPRCPQDSTIGVILLAIYMMLSNVLLLNLLIAMFSYTFSAVQENTDVFWRFQRYDLIKEYFNRPALVPPFIIIAHISFLVRFLIKKFCGRCLRFHTGKLKQRLSKSRAKQLVLWEAMHSNQYIAKEKIRLQSDISEQVRTTGERVEDILGKMEELFAGEKALEDRLNRQEDEMKRTNQALDWIVAFLKDNQLGSKEGPSSLKEVKPREESDFYEFGEEREVPTTLEECTHL
ncbi:transient receptor potential cation channel subfamily M member 2-like isoform X2 [Patiria miniata]|uniref:Uncharacterized protein n=1 Tax=Patiria miniata TaxID=46514 RepID=A0A914BTT6_PATMI|nr:transient receptor potential cation channel subfamily M member 2-like isoform X2 [Patiria miniata]